MVFKFPSRQAALSPATRTLAHALPPRNFQVDSWRLSLCIAHVPSVRKQFGSALCPASPSENGRACACALWDRKLHALRRAGGLAAWQPGHSQGARSSCNASVHSFGRGGPGRNLKPLERGFLGRAVELKLRMLFSPGSHRGKAGFCSPNYGLGQGRRVKNNECQINAI